MAAYHGLWFYGPYAFLFITWIVDVIDLGLSALAAMWHERKHPEPGHPSYSTKAARDKRAELARSNNGDQKGNVMPSICLKGKAKSGTRLVNRKISPKERTEWVDWLGPDAAEFESDDHLSPTTHIAQLTSSSGSSSPTSDWDPLALSVLDSRASDLLPAAIYDGDCASVTSSLLTPSGSVEYDYDYPNADPLVVFVDENGLPNKPVHMPLPAMRHCRSVQERIIATIPAALRDQYRHFPNVLIQLPMYNEEVHCEAVIEQAAKMLWPPQNKLIQVCDDSDDPNIRARVEAASLRMRRAGHNVVVVRRAVRKGFKAGNMLAGMDMVAGRFDYVALFDADFAPEEDFLFHMVCPMMKDRTLAFTQARWTFYNEKVNMLTWLQSVMMHYHFAVEQRSRAFRGSFFGFNGTAGVWRIAAMDAVGGWHTDTTVEDMDLSLRAYLAGWRFKYMDHVHCPSELPPTMASYRSQQFRWMSGPMQVLRKYVSFSTLLNPAIPLYTRASIARFLFRYLQTAVQTLFFAIHAAMSLYCDPVNIPYSQYFLGVSYLAPMMVLPFTYLVYPYMALCIVWHHYRTAAIFFGLLGLRKANTWIVTKKCGADAARTGWNLKLHPPSLVEGLLTVHYLVCMVGHCWQGRYFPAAQMSVTAVLMAGCAFGESLWP